MVSTEDTLRRWRDEEAQARASLGEAGIARQEELLSRSGMDFLTAVMRGELPQAPLAAWLDLVPIHAEPGLVTFQGTPTSRHCNPTGTVHGGYAATLLDTAMACAVYSMLPAGQGYTTLELKINYIRALTVRTGPVRGEGRVINAGAKVGVAEGRIVGPDGKLYAHATTTCLILSQ